ncbi:MAG TPA: MFS transporter [Thermoanaerobaculia bacterium]
MAWAFLTTGVVTLLIVLGSRNLERFDAALVAYTFATLFAVFGLTFRYAVWLQRPSTAVYWRRGWQVFFRRRDLLRNSGIWVRRVTGEFAANDFIWRRGWVRGATHMLLMWGCIIAAAITIPLVFGWLSFETVPGKMDLYRVFVFGFPTITFPHESLFAFLVFHGLVWASLMVIPGVMLAMLRRMRDEGAAALQRFAEDFLPLVLLFAVSVTGLLLTVSYTWLQGYGYDFLALTHAVTVILTLFWLPFGKFFHIFQRPAQLGVEFYKDAASRAEVEPCARCGYGFASKMHVDDLIGVEQRLGYRYEMEAAPGLPDHYQRVCPRCRRAMLALAQGRITGAAASGANAPLPRPMPAYVNPGIGLGPLGTEDQANFHP